MKVGDIVHFNLDYISEYLPLRTGIVLRMKNDMAAVRMLGGSTVITVRASILEVYCEG